MSVQKRCPVCDVRVSKVVMSVQKRCPVCDVRVSKVVMSMQKRCLVWSWPATHRVQYYTVEVEQTATALMTRIVLRRLVTVAVR